MESYCRDDTRLTWEVPNTCAHLRVQGSGFRVWMSARGDTRITWEVHSIRDTVRAPCKPASGRDCEKLFQLCPLIEHLIIVQRDMTV